MVMPVMPSIALQNHRIVSSIHTEGLGVVFVATGLDWTYCICSYYFIFNYSTIHVTYTVRNPKNSSCWIWMVKFSLDRKITSFFIQLYNLHLHGRNQIQYHKLTTFVLQQHALQEMKQQDKQRECKAVNLFHINVVCCLGRVEIQIKI